MKVDGEFGDFHIADLHSTIGGYDRQAAITQGVTHFLGRVLKDLGVAPSAVATVGYRRLLEIVDQTCNDPWQLFLDLQRFNPHTREMRERLGRSLEAVMAAIGGASRTDGGGAST